MSLPALTWEIVDRTQSPLATLEHRKPGGSGTITRHAARTAKVSLDLHDPALAQVDTVSTLLRVMPEGWTDPLFLGRIVSTPHEDGDVVTLNAVDSWRHLERLGVFLRDPVYDLPPGSFPATDTFRFFTSNEDQSQAMWDLIDLVSASGHGIVEGTLAGASVSRDLSFPAGSRIADGVLGIADLMNGPDFELAPVSASDGTLAQFNTFYPRQGVDRTGDVDFRYGFGDENDNAIDLDRGETGEGLVNRFVAIGDVYALIYVGGKQWALHAAAIAEHADSIAANGVFEDSGTVSGTTDSVGVLGPYAAGIVAGQALPNEPFTVTPDPDAGFVFAPDGDYWMGDTIPVSDGSDGATLSGDIGNVVWTEDEPGDVELDLTCDPISDPAGVSVTYDLVLVDPADGQVLPPPDPVTYTPRKRARVKKGRLKGSVESIGPRRRKR